MSELWLLMTKLLENGWKRLLARDATANDSDKTFVVPANTRWFLTNVLVYFQSTSDVGNRVITILYTDASNNVIARMVAGAVQAASNNYYYEFSLGSARETTPVNSNLVGHLDGIILEAGMKVRVYDSAAIAAAADDMTVSLNGLSWTTAPTV